MVLPIAKKLSKYSVPRHDRIIRSEIFTAERFEQHAESLAVSHKLATRPTRKRLLEKSLQENENLLRDIYRRISKAIDEASELPPAAEWLVDNYFVLEEQIRDIRNDLPPRYYLQLPKLAEGYLAGYPRVYGIAWAYVAHTDSFFSPELLKTFLLAYQHKQPLNIGELWAVVVTLRIALVENLRRAAALIIEDRQARSAADLLAERIINFASDDPSMLEHELQRIDKAALSSAFSVQLIQRLRDQDSHVLPLIQRMNERLHREGTSAEEVVRREHQNQGALTVTVRNIITSMRTLSTFDWVQFFESVSLVDQRLRTESDFADMDLPTRNLYRRAIERLAQGSSYSERDVVEQALQMAEAEQKKGENFSSNAIKMNRAYEPGYFLIDKGSLVLEKAINYRPTLRDKIIRANSTINFTIYIIANTLLVTLIIEAGLGSGPIKF